ncbi:MAG: metal-dependent hydrolase, partial [Salibacteraceae bacterium]|nr:metal-dependent hydrolase [Salibacteraceae bacterium]
ANVETEEAYLLANYSFFDTQPIMFESYPKHHDLIADISENERVQRMVHISKGWYTINQQDDQLYFNDLRFGLLSLTPNAQDFVFKYRIDLVNAGNVEFTEEPKTERDAKKLLGDLLTRIKGN